MLTQNLPDFWDNLYAEGKDYWNLKKVTPALTEFFKHPSCPATGSVLVPGAGFGYDAEAWALRGHDVLAVDFAPSAVDELDHLSRKHKNLRSLDLDLFSLSPKDDKRGGQLFDIVYDYCAFTAIHPGRRDEFFEVCYKMMKERRAHGPSRRRIRCRRTHQAHKQHRRSRRQGRDLAPQEVPVIVDAKHATFKRGR